MEANIKQLQEGGTLAADGRSLTPIESLGVETFKKEIELQQAKIVELEEQIKKDKAKGISKRFEDGELVSSSRSIKAFSC